MAKDTTDKKGFFIRLFTAIGLASVLPFIGKKDEAGIDGILQPDGSITHPKSGEVIRLNNYLENYFGVEPESKKETPITEDQPALPLEMKEIIEARPRGRGDIVPIHPKQKTEPDAAPSYWDEKNWKKPDENPAPEELSPPQEDEQKEERRRPRGREPHALEAEFQMAEAPQSEASAQVTENELS